MEYVFGNEDLRRYIFTFLRKKPKKICFDCKCVLVWDKKIKDYIEYGNIGNSLIGNIYCYSCWRKKFNFLVKGCNIS
jgi:tRNA(His) 5'-end guanylyltransferase